MIQVAKDLSEGFAWGQAAKSASQAYTSIQAVKEAAASADLQGFQAGLSDLLAQEGQGIALFKGADALIDRFPAFEELREYLIDLCVVKLLQELEEEEGEAGDAMDSPEWEKIETAAEDRGTELLNALIYIKDCRLNDAEPSLEDFLYDFLLAGEDDFQEEMAIYESFIRQAELVDAPLKQLVEAGNHQRDNDLRDLFTPMMLFFREPEAQPGKITLALLEYSAEPELHCALYNLLGSFYRNEL